MTEEANADLKCISDRGSREGHAEKWHLYVLMMCCVFAAVVYSLGLASGHEWGDDFGAYLHLAKNIQLGRPYDYLTPDMGAMTPPGFPLLIASWSYLTGWDLKALKTVNVLSWALLAIATYGMARQYLSPIKALLAGLAVLCCPFFTYARHSLISDMPYAVISTACLSIASATSMATISRVCRLALVFILCAGVFIAFLFRPATVGLVAALLSYQAYAFARGYLRDRSVDWVALFTAALLIVSTIVFVAMFPGPFKAHGANAASLASSYSPSVRASEEFANFGQLFFGFIAPSWAPKVFLLILCAGAALYVARTRMLSPIHFFAVVYTAMIILTPWQNGPRYLFPIVPIAFVFVLMMGEIPRGSKALRLSASSIGVIVLGYLMVNGIRQIEQARGYSADEIERPEAVELISWLKTNTSVGDKLCAFKPRAFLYLTQRRTADIGSEPHPEAIHSYLRSKQCTFAVVPNRDRMGSLYNAVDAELEEDPLMLKEFHNSTYSVYKVALQN